MRLVSLNIEANLHYDTVLPFLKESKADVICLQEVLEEDFEYLKNELGGEGKFTPWGFSHSPRERYKDFYGKTYGVAIFSKEIVDSGHIFYWGEEEYIKTPIDKFVENIETLRSYSFTWVDIEAENGNIYKVVTTHFPVTKEGESSPHQLEILPSFFKNLNSLGDFVLCGDFNAPRGNKTFSEIAARYKDVIPKEYETSIDQNLHRNKGIMFMVDGLFLTPKYTAENVVLVDGVSDHMAVVATIYPHS